MDQIANTIAVIGAGAVGLASAIRLRERGWPVTIYAAKRSPHITSDRAGAVFSPFRVDGHAEAAQWTQDSWRVFQNLADQIGPACGVKMAPLREYFFNPLAADPWWAAIVRDYRRDHSPPAPYADALRAIVPTMNMSRYMPWLEHEFTNRLGGRIVDVALTDIQTLFERSHRIVVNCSGLGARLLANDTKMTPYRGQIVRVANTLGLTESIVEESVGSISTYVFPFDEFVVLGGTFEENTHEEATVPDAITALIDRCMKMLTAAGVPNAERLADTRLVEYAGLRPCRVHNGSTEAVRLELEDAGHGRAIVHNYGHGRAGVTLSWGCADAVCDIVSRP